MITNKPKLNPDGSVKRVFNPADFNVLLSASAIDLTDYPNLFKNNVFTANNTFNNLTAVENISAPNITNLTTTVNTINDYNSVYNITTTTTIIPVGTVLPNVIFATYHQKVKLYYYQYYRHQTLTILMAGHL